MMRDENSLLKLFSTIQKVLAASSLDPSATGVGRRYDQQISQEDLPQRDMHDRRVAEVGRQLLSRLDEWFDMKVIREKFPLRYLQPMNNLVNRELSLFERLLGKIKGSVLGLLTNLDGAHPRPLEIEELWHAVRANRVPDAWKAVSFPTAKESLSDFLIELCRKLAFWQQIVDNGIDTAQNFWLPAFFEPTAVLEAFRQTRARREGIPLPELKNVIEVLEKPYEQLSPEELASGQVEGAERDAAELTDAQVTGGADEQEDGEGRTPVRYLTGMSLEGANWDLQARLLVELSPGERFTDFPGLRVRTIRVPPEELEEPVTVTRGEVTMLTHRTGASSAL